MSLALYRKYRSRNLDEVIGQKHITDVLSRAIAQDRVSHAYLLTGPRGVGKTSIARILAHEINKLPYSEEDSHLDIIEIDAASNTGVDDIRDLRERSRVAPVSANKKIYIIDEVHMLSKPAFNALLKTLEEPPEHVVFILATTDIDRLPATIVSRTQRFSFRPIGLDDAVNHLKSIAKKEGIKVSDEALMLIAERGEGSFRDSISLLDQLASLADSKEGITTKLIESSLGLATHTTIEEIIADIESKDLESVIKKLETLNNEGVDSAILSRQLVNFINKKITEKPSLLPLIDSLLEVPTSHEPYLKLIAVLGQAALKPQPKSAALALPTKEFTLSVKELSIDLDKPKKSKNKTKRTINDFDYSKLIEHTKKHYVALYSVLSKCTHELESSNLTLYTKNSFYKKKLDDSKYSPLLYKSLSEIGAEDLEVITIASTKPLKDSQAMAVAVIMGGGEEVSLEDGNQASPGWESSAA